jgi:DNA primase
MPFTIWDEIKSKLTISDVIADYLPIQSAGANYRCLCPFHDDKKPSMMLNNQKGIWHCFVCGAGGDIFKFVAEYENINKRQVLEKLSKKAGVQLPALNKNIANENGEAKISESVYEAGLKILDWSAQVYHQILLKLLENRNHPVTQYCLSRSLTPAIISQFRLGYGPKGGFLLNLMRQHGMDVELAVQVGVLKKTDSGEIRDKFTDRLVIPINNRQAQIVGFTARNFPYDNSERPKYLNSSQSQWFNKSELWFGWDLARPHIIQQKHAIIVEGNMDVIASFQHEIKTTLASQGTSFTLEQLKILKQITKTVWLAFDNDEAGIKSSSKLFEMAVQLGFEVSKVQIPTEFKDLDEYLQSGTAQIQGVNYVQWYISLNHNKLTSSDLDQQKRALYDVLKLIKVTDPIAQNQYLQILSRSSGLGMNALEQALKTVQLDNPLDENQIGIDNQPVFSIKTRPHTDILVAWQNALAFGQGDDEMYQGLFVLLRRFLTDVRDVNSYHEYMAVNADILSLIREQSGSQQNHNNVRIIMHFLDQHVSEFLLDEDLKSIYMSLKMKAV